MKQPGQGRRKSAGAPAARRAPVRRWVPLGVVLAGGVAALALGLLCSTWRQTGEVPADLNVLLITIDTTRADALGCYGSATAQTPNLDRLAREGTRFARCSACTPLTGPSHCTIMTGVWPFVHGVRQNGPDVLAPANVTLAEMLKDTGFATHAIVASFILNGMFGLVQGFETYDDAMPAKDRKEREAERKGDEVCERAMAALRALVAERFFLWVHFYDPHYPYESPRVPDVDSPEAYADEVMFMDAQIGRLVEELKQLGIERKTLTVVVGDHGEGLGDHGESQHGYFVYETDMHVPLIAWCPGTVPAAGIVDARVRTVDVVPTILDYLGQPAASRLPGTSLRPLIAGRALDTQLPAYGETMTPQVALGLSALRSLHYDGWKYILSSRPELYHLDSDPHEQNNRVDQQPELAARMRKQLWTVLAEAPPPPGGGGTTAALSQADAQRLAALGYVTIETDSSKPPSGQLTTFQPTGESPADHVEAVERYVRAHELMAERQYGAAEPLLRQVVVALPDGPAPLRELAKALRRLNRQEEIFEVCEQVLTARPDAGETRFYYARLLLGARRFEEALVQLDELVVRNPQRADARCERANALRALDRFNQSRADYEQALRLDPHNSRALHGLAMLCLRQDRLAEGAEYLRKAIEIDPKSAQLKRDLQRVLQDMEQ